MRLHCFSLLALVATFSLCQPRCDATDIVYLPASDLVPVSSDVPNNLTVLNPSGAIERRQDNDPDDHDKPSIFKSLIPITPFKRPIKKIFKSLFEPNGDALKDDSSVSSLYFIKPQKSFLRDISPNNLFSKKHSSVASIPLTVNEPFPNGRRSYNTKYPKSTSLGSSYDNSFQASSLVSRQASSQSPTFAIGDPANGRGMTVSFGDANKASESSYGVATNQNYQNSVSPSNGDTGGGGLSFSLGGRNGGRGLSLSLGGGGGGGSGMSLSLGGGGGGGSGGRGMSLSLGGGDGGSGGRGMSLSLGGGGGSGGRGMSLSLGGGGGGSGMSLNFGGNGGGESNYQPSGSASYPSYSSNYSPSYGSSYGSSYGNSYSNGYGYDYKQKPKFSITMPSHGKTVVEANLRPPLLKMKLNASPKVKITTGTKDPLEKPPLEDEPIMEDIFGPPEPFEKPDSKNKTLNETVNGVNGTAFNGTYYPGYPYPPYSYPHYYPHMYQYPYNYYYNYYQQYPQHYYNYYQQPYAAGVPSQPQYSAPGTQYPRTNYGNSPSGYASASTTNLATKTGYRTTNNDNYQQNSQQSSTGHIRQTSHTSQSSLVPSAGNYGKYPSEVYSYSQNTVGHSTKQPYQSLASNHQPAPLSIIDNNSVSYKRSSASRNYQKDMLTFGSNPVATYSKPSYSRSAKNLLKPQESKTYYSYEKSPKLESPKQNSLATNNHYQYQPPQYGTGAGYTFYSNATNQYNGTYPGSHYYNPYYNPYYYNYYYNYYKQYYDSYYGNYSSYYKKNKTSISGFNQHSFDHHQSKIFGSKIEKYPGGSTKEDKSRVIFDIRPRVTFKMLNKTEQMEQHKELKKKKKDHIFKTKLTILMQSTTAKPAYDYNSYYGYKYDDEDVDEFGYTHDHSHIEPATTPKPLTTTTRRRTTTEEPSSQESSEEEPEEETTSEENTSQEEEEEKTSTTSTTTEASDVEDESTSEEVEEDGGSKESTTSTTTTTSKPPEEQEEDEVIDDNEDATNEDTTSEEQKSEDESEKADDSGPDANKLVANNVTVSPELVAAMIKALQEALGVTPPNVNDQPNLTTPLPSLSTLTSIDDEGQDEVDDDELNETSESEHNGDNQEEGEEIEEEPDTTTTTTKRPRFKATAKERVGSRSKPIPKVISTVVQDTTQLRLKTPVLNVQSQNKAASNMVRQRLPVGRKSERVNSKIKSNGKKKTSNQEVTTTSPFLIVNKASSAQNKAAKKVIDGNALLSNFNIDDLSDEERRDMLTNIMGVLQNKIKANEIEQTPKESNTKRKSKSSAQTIGTKLFPVTKANNVRIVSSLDELTGENPQSDKSNGPPIYVVLLPQNKKKK